MAAALGTYAWRGWYARYVTDDFCTASELRAVGFIEAMKYHRHVWSGRYAYFAIKAGLETIGPITARFTPAIMILLLLGAAWSSIRRLLRPADRIAALLAALAITYATVDTSPSLTNIGGAWFWETGALTYTLPLILITLWFGLFASTRSLGGCCAASALLLFVAGGLSETSLAAQGALAGGILVVALLFRARREAWIAAAGIAATVLALVIVATAPGNVARVPALPGMSPVAAIVRAASMADRYLGNFAFVSPGLLLALLGGAVAGVRARRLRTQVAVAGMLVAIAAYLVSFLPAAWLIPQGPPERALDVPNYFLILALFAGAAAAANALAERRRIPGLVTAAVLLCAALLPLRSAVMNLETMPDLRRGAARMDALVRLLEASPGRDIVVHDRWPLELRLLDRDPGFFTNRCVSRYYALHSLRVEPRGAGPVSVNQR